MYSQIFAFILASFSLLSLGRFGLVVWQWRRVNESQGMWSILRGGLRIDAHLIAICVAPAVLVAPWLSGSNVAAAVIGAWFQMAWILICLLELSTPLFIVEYDTRPNRLYVDYLKHPREVCGMIWKGYKTVAVLVVAGLLFLSVMGRFLFTAWGPGFSPSGLIEQSGILLASSLLVSLAIRGTLRHRPINPSTVAFCSDPLLNALALNSLYSVAYAVYSMKNERSPADAYGELPEQEVIALIRRQAFMSPTIDSAQIPTLHKHGSVTVHRDPTPRHIVLIVEESLGAKYTGHLGGLPLTPNLDALSDEAWTFTRAYATGTRSVRGLEALVAGFPPSLSDAVLRLPGAQSRFFTLAHLLKNQGYRSRFIYGGEAHFDNMKGFFLGNGFEELHDLETFRHPKFVGTWGVSDEDMFDRLHTLLSERSVQPTFTLAFSVSNHSPWEYPSGRILPQGEPATVENTVRYADWALGRFFEQARRSSYWDNTLFLVVADHEARVGGQQLVPVKYFHIPAMILGGGVKPRVDKRIVSQIDLPVTLLSMLGIETEHPMIGHDLTDRQAGGRALMQYGENFGYLKGDQLVVLEPNRPATQWRYTISNDLIAVLLDEQLRREALAHALWPDLAYRTGSYTLPTLRSV
ncbi:LTA synthase family protein [Parapusillimonas sp. JC17]|uniref:LTA synthase family protein n=1 Tax=Parapusillimonas sp. JC17 TaxID=3445768 RepID=UPI003FA11208